MSFIRSSALRQLALTTTALAALTLAAPALAAETAETAVTADDAAAAESDAGSELIVTARHREERLQDVPLAISAMAGQELNGQHLDRIADYAAKIPNFSAFATNPRVATVNIRGLGGNASNDGAEGGVGVIVDDVFFTHVGFAWLDFVDLESVEVARGPQGTLLGKNTTIGAVVVRTAKPSFDPSLTVTGTVANHGRWQVRANATGPIIADKLAGRITFAGDTGGGWVTNAFNGDKLLDNNRWSVRGQLLFTPTDNVSNRIIAEHYAFAEFNNHTSPNGEFTQNLYIADPTGTHADNSVFSARTANWANAIQRVAPGYVPNYNGPQNANFDTLHRTRQKVDGVSNHLDIDFGGVSLTSVTAWRKLWFRPENDFDLTPYPVVDLGYDVDVNQLSQELRLASPSGGTLEWQLGAYYLHEKVVSDFHQRFFANASKFYISAAADPAVLNGLTYSKRGEVKVDSGAVFAQTTLRLSDAFTVTGGVRFTREGKTLDVAGRTLPGSAATADSALSAANLATRNGVLANFGGLYPTTRLKSTGSYWSWLVNPSLKLSDDVLLYVNASGGAKSGAANTTANPALIAAGKALIKPEKSLDFEAGIKSTWLDRRLTVNLNLYSNTITDYQAGQIDPNALALGSILGNVGKVRLRGFELETALEPVEGVTLSANLAYNDAKYLSYANAPAPTEYQAYLATVQGVAARSTVLSLTGQQVIGAPKWTANGTASFDRPIAEGVNLTGYVNLSYRSRTALISPLSQYGWQKAFVVTNAGFGIKSPDGQWSASIWAKNLFNQEYAISYGAPSAVTPLLKYYGEPRTFGLTLSKTF
jgi:iron complex outermembrane receptor protein